MTTDATTPTGLMPALQRGARKLAALAGGSESLRRVDWTATGVTALAFVLLFAQPFIGLAQDWWSVPEAGHGLLLAPVAIWLAWQAGIRSDSAPQPAFGLGVLIVAVAVRCAAGLAAEIFTMRASMVMALAGLTLFWFGHRQLRRWWLPFTLLALSIPLPEIVTQALALPLQFQASRMGAALLELRNVPVLLTGNVIRIPGHELFVTEACSGLRSITALLSVGVLASAMFLRTTAGRIALVALTIPIAIAVNGLRVFVTGYLVYYISPDLGTGFMHETEGWLLFLVSLAALGVAAWLVMGAERRFAGARSGGVSTDA